MLTKSLGKTMINKIQIILVYIRKSAQHLTILAFFED